MNTHCQDFRKTCLKKFNQKFTQKFDTKFIQKVFVRAALAAFAACILANIMHTKQAHAQPGKNLRIANSREIETLDPTQVDGSDAGLVADALFEGLVVLDPSSLEPKPGVAMSWEVSKDGLTYTFNLRKNARWSNGRTLTSEDFLFAWERALTPETGAYYSKYFDSIKGAEEFRKGKTKEARNFAAVGIVAKTPYTLVVTLKQPAPYFLELLSQAVFYPVPKEAIGKHGKEWTKPEYIVTNGPFSLLRWKLKDSLTLGKSQTYHDASKVKLDTITVFPLEDAKTALNMYNAGEIDWLRRIPNAQFSTLKSHPEFHSGKMLGTAYLRFNTTRGPLKDARVRQAISMAIDRTTLTEKVLKEGQVPAAQFVTPGMRDYLPAAQIKEDVQKARDLLAQAGFPEGKNFPALSVLFVSDDQSKNAMIAVSTMLKKNLGIHISPKNQERGVYYDALDALNFDIARSTWSASYMDAKSYLDKFTSDNTYNNLTGYANPAYDKLIKDASLQTDLKARNALFAQAEKLLVVDDAVIVPLYYSTSINMWKKSVTGLFVNPLDAHPLKSLDVDNRTAQK